MKIVRTLLALGFLLALGASAVYLLNYRYENTKSSVSVQQNELSGELLLEPAAMIIPQDIQLSWALEGINSVFINFDMEAANGSRSIAAYCSRARFDMTEHDLSISLTPFVWVDPINTLLLALVLGSLVSMLGLILAPSKAKAVRQRLREAFDLKRIRYKSFWERNTVFWQRLALLLIVWLTLPLILFPACLAGDGTSLVGSLLVALTGLSAFICLLISIFKPDFLTSLLQKISQHLPYSVTIAFVFIYWGLCYASILGKNAFVAPQLAAVVLCAGLAILYFGPNKENQSLTLALPTSPLPRLFTVLVALFLWLLLYFSHWIGLFNNLFLQTLFGLLLFILPGTLWALIVLREARTWHHILTLGFVLSIFLATLLGYLAIVLGLSAIMVQAGFATLGLLALLYLLLIGGSFELRFRLTTNQSFYDVFLLACAVLAVFILWAISINPPPVDDTVTYNAMVTEFAQSPHYSFQDHFLGTANLMPSRLWLTAWPVSQSLIVNFAELNIMYAMSDLSGLLAILVAIAIYDLFSRFQLDNTWLYLSLIFTAFAFSSQADLDQVGMVFSERLIHDKSVVAWILTPTLLALVYDFLSQRTIRNTILLALTTFTIVNSHATAFFYAALLAGMLVCLYVVFRSRRWLDIVIIGLIMGLCALIPLALREVSPDVYAFDGGSVTRLPEYHRPRLDLSEDTTILGIAPRLRSGAAFWLLYGACAVALVTIRKQLISYYIIAGCLLLLLVSNPFTAPLIGRAVTPYHIWRATWFVPLGVGAAFFCWGLTQILSMRSAQLARLVIAEVVILVLVAVSNALIVRPHEVYTHIQEFVAIGTNIPADSAGNPITVLTNPVMNTFVPTINWNLSPLIWRDGSHVHAGISDEEAAERNADLERFFADDLTLEEMNELLAKYNVQYIILVQGTADHLQALISESPHILPLETSQNYALWQIEALP